MALHAQARVEVRRPTETAHCSKQCLFHLNEGGPFSCANEYIAPGNREISKKNREAIEHERAITERD